MSDEKQKLAEAKKRLEVIRLAVKLGDGHMKNKCSDMLPPSMGVGSWLFISHETCRLAFTVFGVGLTRTRAQQPDAERNQCDR
jgi:hypothetical protein